MGERWSPTGWIRLKPRENSGRMLLQRPEIEKSYFLDSTFSLQLRGGGPLSFNVVRRIRTPERMTKHRRSVRLRRHDAVESVGGDSIEVRVSPECVDEALHNRVAAGEPPLRGKRITLS